MKPTIEQAIEATRLEYGLDAGVLEGRSRTAKVAHARAMLMHMLTAWYSLTDIGKALERHHSTVFAARNKVNAEVRYDEKAGQEAFGLRKRLAIMQEPSVADVEVTHYEGDNCPGGHIGRGQGVDDEEPAEEPQAEPPPSPSNPEPAEPTEPQPVPPETPSSTVPPGAQPTIDSIRAFLAAEGPQMQTATFIDVERALGFDTTDKNHGGRVAGLVKRWGNGMNMMAALVQSASADGPHLDYVEKVMQGEKARQANAGGGETVTAADLGRTKF